MTPAQLVDEIQRGNREAEEELYSRFYPGLRIMLMSRTRDHARAEDIAQDTMITVLDRIRSGNIDQPDQIHRFIQQTGKFQYIGWTRRSINKTEWMESVDEIAHATETVEESLMQTQARQTVRDLILELTVPRDREILHRYYVLDESKLLICEALDLTAGHFDRVINRARERFKKLFSEQTNE